MGSGLSPGPQGPNWAPSEGTPKPAALTEPVGPGLDPLVPHWAGATPHKFPRKGATFALARVLTPKLAPGEFPFVFPRGNEWTKTETRDVLGTREDRETPEDDSNETGGDWGKTGEDQIRPEKTKTETHRK